MYKANGFRNKDALKMIPGDRPGYYKWWASKDDFLRLLSALDVPFEEINADVEQKDGLWCVYVGIAAKESIRSRINWHINDPHTESKVKSGTLSTLRQSIASLVAGNQFDKVATDSFIDGLSFEVFPVEGEIGSCDVTCKLHDAERKMLGDRLCILNIQDNCHVKAAEIKKKLKALRKASK